MARPSVSLARYRRRAWTIGVLLALVLFVVGAPRYVSGIEDDLEERVPAELGIDGVSAAFSGQDGTLNCTEPLADPEAALSAAFDVRGVRNIELDRSCRVRSAPIVDATTADAAAPTTTVAALAGAEVADTAADPTVAPTAPPATELSIAELIDSDSDLSLLAVMLREADLVELVQGEAVTFFAPTNAAFDALPADVLALVRGEPEVMRQVMEFHVVDGERPIADLEASGEVVASDGSPIVIEPAEDGLLIGGVRLNAGDVGASNGVMHLVDGLMVPDDVDLRPVTGPPVEARSADDAMTLTGIVATEVERQALSQAAAAGGQAVDDRLTVDAEMGLDGARTTDLAALVRVLGTELVGGSASFDGTGLVLRGTYRTDEQRAAAESAAAAVDARVELAEAPRPEPSTQPADIEAELNALVAASPIRFDSASDELDAGAAPILDQLAGELTGLAGVTVTIEGHTDSDGTASRNQALSQGRAEAVLAALVERGVAADLLSAEGFGSSEPVLVDGAEDKVASRRVEFRVVADT